MKLKLKRYGVMFLTVLFVSSIAGFAGHAWAVPPNPEKTIYAKSCKEARANLRLALKGNPLIGKAESEEFLKKAKANFWYFCVLKK